MPASALFSPKGLYFTQLVSEYRINNKSEDVELVRYYGSLLRSMLSLFQAVSGGVDWDNLVEPLMREISPALACLFALYIAFCVLAMMNVVTGVFVEAVLLSAKNDKDQALVNNAREIFKSIDGGIRLGSMTIGDFQEKLETPQMQQFFSGIEVEPSDVKGLFALLDEDGSGTVDAEEFLNACLRLRGPAKALDMAMLIQLVRNQHILLHSTLQNLHHNRHRRRSSKQNALQGVDSSQGVTAQSAE